MPSLGVVPGSCVSPRLLLYITGVAVTACVVRILSGRVVPDGVVGPQANPLGDGAVLLLRFGKLLLGAERLVGLRDCQR